MAEININPFFDEMKVMKVKGDRQHCRQHNPSDFEPVGLHCTCDRKNKMPDWGFDDSELEFEMNRDPVLEARRKRAGLPIHVKCDCKDCAQWRSKNGHLIEGLDWTDKPYLQVNEVHISPMPAGFTAPKPMHNTVIKAERKAAKPRKTSTPGPGKKTLR